jgi:hypothetical protein
MSERRRHTRIPFDLPAVLDGPAGRLQTRVVDISLKGVLISLEQLPEERFGDWRLHIQLAANAEISMELDLVHVQSGRAGFACRRIDIDSLAHLKRLFELNLADPPLLQRELEELGS